MRATAGDYRKKMEEEKSKQFKLIQSGECICSSGFIWMVKNCQWLTGFSVPPTELASAQVKLVSESPKKSVFHRRAELKPQQPHAEEKLQQTEARDAEPTAQTQEATSAFLFVPSKEEFSFNFFWFASPVFHSAVSLGKGATMAAWTVHNLLVLDN